MFETLADSFGRAANMFGRVANLFGRVANLFEQRSLLVWKSRPHIQSVADELKCGAYVAGGGGLRGLLPPGPGALDQRRALRP